MQYVIKNGDNTNNWVFFDTYEAAVRAAGSWAGARVPELNLTKIYGY